MSRPPASTPIPPDRAASSPSAAARSASVQEVSASRPSAPRSRRGGGSLGVARLDLDNFRALNETYSRADGDQLLRAVATSLSLTTRMGDLAARYPIVAWKVYTHAGGPGWYLDDHDPAAPQVGRAVLDRALQLGVDVVAVHKGFGGSSRFASPVDVGLSLGLCSGPHRRVKTL